MQVSCEFASDFFEKRLHYCTTIAPQKSCEKAANRRAASHVKPTSDTLCSPDLLVLYRRQSNDMIYLILLSILGYLSNLTSNSKPVHKRMQLIIEKEQESPNVVLIFG